MFPIPAFKRDHDQYDHHRLGQMQRRADFVVGVGVQPRQRIFCGTDGGQQRGNLELRDNWNDDGNDYNHPTGLYCWMNKRVGVRRADH